MIRKAMILATLLACLAAGTAQAQRWAYPSYGPGYFYNYAPYGVYYGSPYYGGYTYTYQPWSSGYGTRYYTGYAPYYYVW